MLVSIEEFLKDGKLGNIELGMNRSDVLAYLGKPEAWMADQQENVAKLWKYKSLEIGFNKDVVNFIGLYFIIDDLCFQENITLRGFTPNRHTKLNEFQMFLEEKKIQYQIDPKLTFDSQTCLKVGSNLQIYTIFDESDELYSLQYADIVPG